MIRTSLTCLRLSKLTDRATATLRLDVVLLRSLSWNQWATERVITLFQLLSSESPANSEISFDVIGCGATVNHHLINKMTKA